MRKIFLTLAAALMVVAASAQTVTMKVNFESGQAAVYQCNHHVETESQMGNKTIDVVYDTRYQVESVNADSCILNMQITSVNATEGSDDNQIVQAFNAMKGLDVKLSADASGSLRRILNYTDVHDHMLGVLKSFVDKTFELHPEAAQQMSKEEMYKTMDNLLTPDNLLSTIEQNDVFSLAGKTITSGQTEDSENNGIKQKDTYTVGNVFGIQTVAVTSKSAMTKDDVKAMFFAQLEQAGLPQEQIDQAKSQWSMIEASGMANLDFNGTETYHFAPNGWVSDIASSSKLSLFGQNITTTSSTKLTEHSWK